jgi:hypothetical protein
VSSYGGAYGAQEQFSDELNVIVVTGEDRGRVWAAWERGWSPVTTGFFAWLYMQ